MQDINSVHLTGRLTRDAELTFTKDNTALAKFSIAVNRSKKSGDKWEDEASFFDCVLWGKQAEALAHAHAHGEHQTRPQENGNGYGAGVGAGL